MARPGDEGPYVELAGPRVWVPRTVPWRRARTVALDAAQNGEKAKYLGQGEGELLGFTRDCSCEEYCELAYVDDEPTGEHPCRVPVWQFELVED